MAAKRRDAVPLELAKTGSSSNVREALQLSKFLVPVSLPVDGSDEASDRTWQSFELTFAVSGIVEIVEILDLVQDFVTLRDACLNVLDHGIEAFAHRLAQFLEVLALHTSLTAENLASKDFCFGQWRMRRGFVVVQHGHELVFVTRIKLAGHNVDRSESLTRHGYLRPVNCDART